MRDSCLLWVAASVLVLAPPRLGAQSLSVGLKGGAPFTNALSSSFNVVPQPHAYTIGPMLEVALPFSLAVEVDALYRRTGYSAATPGATVQGDLRANSWEFPILGKYYLPGAPLVRPYLEGGYAVRRFTSLDGIFRAFDTTFRVSAPLQDDLTHGVVAGAGLRFRLGPLRVAPGIRYTRWTGRSFEEVSARGFFVRATQNQAEFLVGLSF